MVTHTPSTLSTADQVFLSARQVFTRYGWGKSKGYEMLKADGFPNSIGGRYRLDSLIGWEEDLLGGTSQISAPVHPEPGPDRPGRAALTTPNTTLLPTRRRTRGAAVKGAI